MPLFKIAAAQVPSVRGDISGNIASHGEAIDAAAGQGVSVVVFGELSLTGYEPDLANELTITETDNRLKPLVLRARRHQTAVIVGAPLQNGTCKPWLGAILINADGSTRTYCKMHLGGVEPRFFTPGDEPLAFAVGGHIISIAICADSSRPDHPRQYAESGSDIYAAGVFLNAEWYATDSPRYSNYAAKHRLLTVMANHGASIGTYVSVGKSAMWAPGGELLAQADGVESALVIAAQHESGWSGDVVRF